MLSTVSSLSAETFIDSSLTILTVALFLLSEGFVSPDFVAVSSDVDFSISCILCLFISTVSSLDVSANIRSFIFVLTGPLCATSSVIIPILLMHSNEISINRASSINLSERTLSKTVSNSWESLSIFFISISLDPPFTV